MPGCPRCGQQWPDGYDRCPNDGTGLTPAFAGNAAVAQLPVSDEDLPAGSIAGEYRIEKKIGEGGMGSVYGARHPLIGKRAAIKVIRRELSSNREAVDRFVLEAQSVNQIGHPNIVDIFGFGALPDGRSFFVMEWLEGESLRERLQRPLQFPEALETLEHIAKALQAAHEAGVVHRDLKPDNVFMQARKGEKPTVKLLDFGLAKLTNATESQFHQTRTGMVMGTPLYLSPEQAKGTKIDAATDVYSLGAMSYEMLAGVVPFKADSAVEIMAMHISAPAVPLSDLAPWVPPDVNRLVLAMLEKDPKRRPTTAQVREQIAAFRSGVGAQTLMSPAGGGGSPAWTPQGPASTPQGRGPQSTPYPPQSSPYPGQSPSQSPHSSPYPAQSSQPPHSSPPFPSPGSQPPMYVTPYAPPAAGGKRLGVIIGALIAAGAVLGVGAFLVFGGKKEKKASPDQVAQTQPDTTKPDTTTNPGTNPDTTKPDTTTNPAGTNPAGTNPGTNPTGTNPTGTNPGTNPTGTNPTGTNPTGTDPVGTNPDTTKPDTTKPDTTNPDTTKPDTTKPDTTKPDTTKPNITKPDRPKTGRVTVSFSGPAKAMVLVDGKPYGRETSGRVTLDLPPGEHTVRVQAKGFKPADTKVRVDAAGSRDVKLTLEKKKTVNAVEDPFAD